MKNLIKIVALLLIFNTVSLYQVAAQKTTPDMNTATADLNRDGKDDTSKWGLLGLLGLLGLAGLRKKEPTNTFTTSTTPHNR